MLPQTHRVKYAISQYKKESGEFEYEGTIIAFVPGHSGMALAIVVLDDGNIVQCHVDQLLYVFQ